MPIAPMLRRSLAGVLLALSATTMACMLTAGRAPAPDITTVKSSKLGLYRASIRLGAEPVPVRKLTAWTLHLETAAGVAVDTATIYVDGGMPQHGHGLPTRPRVVADLGHGDHRIEGLKFSMGGWWRMLFVVRSPAGLDTVVFNLSI